MSTIGFRFDDLASPPPTKKSFFQRMNESHGTFISQMRTKKANAPEERRQAHIERSRKRSQSNLSAVSLAHSVQPPRESKEVEEVVASPRGSIARPNSDYSVSNYHANMPGDVDQRRTALQGMQRMMNWKQTPHDATLTRPFHISPPQTPTNSSRSWSSSTSLASDMSDEQMEQWLEQPIDAELHRYRKSSAASSTSSIDSKFNVEDFGIKEYRARKDSHSPSLTTSIIPEVDEPEYDATNSASMRSASTTSLPTPNSFLSALSFGSEAGKKEAWRLSGIILEDFKLESQST